MMLWLVGKRAWPLTQLHLDSSQKTLETIITGRVQSTEKRFKSQFMTYRCLKDRKWRLEISFYRMERCLTCARLAVRTIRWAWECSAQQRSHWLSARSQSQAIYSAVSKWAARIGTIWKPWLQMQNSISCRVKWCLTKRRSLKTKWNE